MNEFGLHRLNRKHWSAALQSRSVPEPARFILMHEPTAMAYLDQFCHGHCARGQITVTREQLKRDRQKFISAIAFGDGRAAQGDSTKALVTNPTYSVEPTGDWICC